MGQGPSAEKKEEIRRALGAHIYEAMLKSEALPDVGIARHLLESPELRPESAAHDRFRELREHVESKGPDYLNDLMAQLAAFTVLPPWTGLLTLLVSMAMETAYALQKGAGPPQGTVPEKRLAQLRDLAEEYLKRHVMHLDDERRLREDTERLEGQVSLLLTQIKNAALADGLINSRILKHWVNGAAFHVQMLIHLARLGGQSNRPARIAIGTYQEGLRELLPAYRKYKSTSLRMDSFTRMKPFGNTGLDVFDGYHIKDCDVGRTVRVRVLEDTHCSWQNQGEAFWAEAYLDHLFANNRQITDIEAYFSRTLSSLHALIPQTGLPQSPASNA